MGAGMKKISTSALGVSAAMIAAQLALAPNAHALCTPQQWQANPDYCQQVFQREGPGPVPAPVSNPNDVWVGT